MSPSRSPQHHRELASTRRCSTCRGRSPLEEWPARRIAALPKGISRHLVRFANLSGRVVAIKETTEEMAQPRVRHAAATSRAWTCPASSRSRVITGRTDADGEPLAAASSRAHLKFSLPYRALFIAGAAPRHRHPPRRRARGAAGPPAHRRLLLGRRVAVEHAVPPRRRRVRRLPGRCRDRRAARDGLTRRPARARPRGRAHQHRRRDHRPRGRRPASTRTSTPSPSPTASSPRYRSLWAALTDPRRSRPTERWRISERVERLNDLGFDIGELSITHRRRRHQGPDPAEGRRCRAPLAAACCGSPASTPRRTRRAGCSTTSTSTARHATGRARTRRWSRTSG